MTSESDSDSDSTHKEIEETRQILARKAKEIALQALRTLREQNTSTEFEKTFTTSDESTIEMATVFKKAQEVTRLIRHDFSGKPDELQDFLNDCTLADKYCPDEFKNNLLIEIVSHITKAARSDLQGVEITTWTELKEYLLKKYKYQHTFDQLCDQLSSIEQTSSEKISDYADRIRHLIWKAKEAGTTEGETAEFMDKVLEKLALNRFKNHSQTETSRFLRIKGVTTFDQAVQEALEEERQSRPTLKKKFCSYCKLPNHTYAECRKKNKPSTSHIVTCAYCKIPGHHISECRKKAYQDKFKSSSQQADSLITFIQYIAIIVKNQGIL